jgi:hypothetical protein
MLKKYIINNTMAELNDFDALHNNSRAVRVYSTFAMPYFGEVLRGDSDNRPTPAVCVNGAPQDSYITFSHGGRQRGGVGGTRCYNYNK